VQEEPIMSASLHKYANDNRRLQTQAIVTKENEETNDRSHLANFLLKANGFLAGQESPCISLNL
jgi:hypothetical protein